MWCFAMFPFLVFILSWAPHLEEFPGKYVVHNKANDILSDPIECCLPTEIINLDELRNPDKYGYYSNIIERSEIQITWEESKSCMNWGLAGKTFQLNSTTDYYLFNLKTPLEEELNFTFKVEYNEAILISSVTRHVYAGFAYEIPLLKKYCWQGFRKTRLTGFIGEYWNGDY